MADFMLAFFIDLITLDTNLIFKCIDNIGKLDQVRSIDIFLMTFAH